MSDGSWDGVRSHSAQCYSTRSSAARLAVQQETYILHDTDSD
jgi:hypothetical protein